MEIYGSNGIWAWAQYAEGSRGQSPLAKRKALKRKMLDFSRGDALTSLKIVMKWVHMRATRLIFELVTIIFNFPSIYNGLRPQLQSKINVISFQKF